MQLDFSVDDSRYRAVRVVREMTAKSRAVAAGGRHTKEARLERCRRRRGEAPALERRRRRERERRRGARRQRRRADRRRRALLGLTFEHFTTCVVLPQGQFARFLHHKPGDRQDLLVELLDLGVYGRMGSLARSRATAATQQVEWLGKERERYGFASPAAVRAAADRVRDHRAAAIAPRRAQPRIDELRAGDPGRRAQATDATEVVERLLSVEVPERRGRAGVGGRPVGRGRSIGRGPTSSAAAAALAAAEQAVDELPRSGGAGAGQARSRRAATPA